jgi:hypothetical protein
MIAKRLFKTFPFIIFLLYAACMTIGLSIMIKAHARPWANPDPAVSAFVWPTTLFSGSAFDAAARKIIQVVGLPAILSGASIQIRVIYAYVFYA